MPDPLPQWMVTVRVYGSILYGTRKWGNEGEQPFPLKPQHIDDWMKDLADHGITTVLWRANCAGTLTYPSKFTALAGEAPLSDHNTVGTTSGYPGFRPGQSPLNTVGVTIVKQGWPPEDWRWLGEQCRHFNTLEAAVKSAHRHSLQLFLDFSTFDCPGVACTPYTWPAGGQRCWNPDWWLWSKDQKGRLAGIPCYADPVVRHRRVGEITEALDMGIDGVALGFFSHCDGLSGDELCAFGYNPAIVEEYRQRHSVDPLTQEVDPHRFYGLHGEHFTQFVRDASQVVRGKGKKLLATTRVDGIHGWGGAACGGLINGDMGAADLRDGKCNLPYAAAFYLEWERWLADNLVDGLLVAAPAQDGVEAVQRMKRNHTIPLCLYRKYTGFKGELRPMSLDVYRSEVEAVRAGGIDGYCLLVMQISPHSWFTPDWRELYRRLGANNAA